MIKESKAYKYASWCIQQDNNYVGIYVKKQAERWLNIANGIDSEAYVNEKFYKKICKILKLMMHPDLGCSIYEGMEDYQWFFVVAILCTRWKSNDRRYYETGLLEISRKNYKTFVSAIIFIIEMLVEPQFSRFFSVAPDFKLSSELRLAVRKIIKVSPALEKYFKINRDMITCKITEIEYTPLAYSNDKMDGKLANIYLADEAGAMDGYPIEAMRSSQITLINKLGIIISTQYPNDNNAMIDEIDIAKKVLDGLIEKRNYFALLYEPNQELTKEWETNEGYIDISKVKECVIVEDLSFWIGKKVYLAFDLSQTGDNTALAMVAEYKGIIYAKVWGFIPHEKIEIKSNKEKVDYKKLIKQGVCFSCGDEVIYYSFVENFIMNIENKYKVEILSIGYDRWNALSTAQKLENAGYEMVEIKQHSSVLHPATKLLEEYILSKKFKYDENRLLEINFQNARCTEDTNKNKYVNKKKSEGKVDMVVALINAIYLLQQEQLNQKDCTIQVI